MLADGPSRDLHRAETGLEPAELGEAAGVGGGRVIGHASVNPGRLLEHAPFLEERNQLRMGAAWRLRTEQGRGEQKRHGNSRA